MSPKQERGAVQLDDVSKAIIEQLQQDGRRSYAAIGKVVGLSEAAVRQRVQRLIDGGVMQVVAVTDVVPAAAGDLAASCGARVVPDVAGVLAEGPDAVYVCVPPFAHGPAERAVIEAGIPLFVEKPISLDLDLAGDLARRIDEVFDLFPRLRERRDHHAGSLSGGERRALEIGRSLMLDPTLVLMDPERVRQWLAGTRERYVAERVATGETQAEAEATLPP